LSAVVYYLSSDTCATPRSLFLGRWKVRSRNQRSKSTGKYVFDQTCFRSSVVDPIFIHGTDIVDRYLI